MSKKYFYAPDVRVKYASELFARSEDLYHSIMANTNHEVRRNKFGEMRSPEKIREDVQNGMLAEVYLCREHGFEYAEKWHDLMKDGKLYEIKAWKPCHRSELTRRIIVELEKLRSTSNKANAMIIYDRIDNTHYVLRAFAPINGEIIFYDHTLQELRKEYAGI